MSTQLLPKEVIVHPVVLLSVVDHYYRLAKETTRRVVGVLLGEYIDGKLDVTNCYAIPFEEDTRDKKVWFVDHVYNEKMYEMLQKINHKELIVGWYSSGPKIRPHDIEINDVFRKYTPNPVFCIIDVQEKGESLGIPSEAYFMKEEVDIDGQLIKTFEKLPTRIEATETEKIGVEFLLRDINEHNKSSMVHMSNDKVSSIKALIQRLTEIKKYLSNVLNKKLTPNPLIISNIQEIFNYLPNFETEDIIKALSNQINDNHLVLYLSWMVKSTVTLHKLIDNKIMMKEDDENKEKESKENKEKELKEKEEKEQKEQKEKEKKAKEEKK